MKTYKAKQYAKILEDGSIDLVTTVLKTTNRTYYYPSEATCAAFGYSPVDVIGDGTEEKGYKVFDDGIKLIERDGKKIVQRTFRKLQIVDDGPNPGPGQEVKSDKWREIDGKWVHVYKYRSISRHITPTKFDPPEPKVEEVPQEPAPELEPAPEAEQVLTPVEGATVIEETPAAVEEPQVEPTEAPAEEVPAEVTKEQSATTEEQPSNEL